MKIIVVVDVQNDFTYGPLGSAEAAAAIGNIMERLMQANDDDIVIFTQDTHRSNYLETREGKNLPITHCLKGTDGWNVVECVSASVPRNCSQYWIEKGAFGSYELAGWIEELTGLTKVIEVEEIELFGFCTDICVVSNALMLKSTVPEVKISVRANCCAGVTPEKHEAALEVMRSCQIEVI